MTYDCGNCNHHWKAEQHQECCPNCNSWHVMTTSDWSESDALEGDPAPAEELTPEGIQLVIVGAERVTAPTEAEKQGSLW